MRDEAHFLIIDFITFLLEVMSVPIFRHPGCFRSLETFPFDQQHLECAVCFALDGRISLGGSHPPMRPAGKLSFHGFLPSDFIPNCIALCLSLFLFISDRALFSSPSLSCLCQVNSLLGLQVSSSHGFCLFILFVVVIDVFLLYCCCADLMFLSIFSP